MEVKKTDVAGSKRTCMLKIKKLKPGFSLIELLVVVSVISILLAIIVPSLNKVKQKASAVVCLSNLNQWYLVIKMSTDDRNGYFHTGWAGNANMDKSEWWMGHLRNYYDNIEEFRCCPIAKSTRKSPPFKAWQWRYSQGVDQPDIGSYAINGWVENKPDESFDSSEFFLQPDAKPNYWRNIKRIKNSSKVPLMTDSNWLDAWPQPDHKPPAESDMEYSDQAGHFTRIVQDRHLKKQNVLFADGSADTIDLKRLWTLKWHRNYDTAGPWTVAGGVTHDDWKEQASWMANYTDY